MKDNTSWWQQNLVIKRVYAILVVLGVLIVATMSTYALMPSEVEQIPPVQPIQPTLPPEDNPLYTLNEVKATIATSIYSKLPEVHKTFSRSGPLQNEKSIRDYNDFSAKYVDASYLGKGEWGFTAFTVGAEFRREYLHMNEVTGVWNYRETETYFTLKVTGIYFEKIHKFDIRLVERVDEEEQVGYLEI